MAICHIDSGVNLTAATRDQYFYNPGEYAGVLGVDDDGNGVNPAYLAAREPCWGGIFSPHSLKRVFAFLSSDRT